MRKEGSWLLEKGEFYKLHHAPYILPCLSYHLAGSKSYLKFFSAINLLANKLRNVPAPQRISNELDGQRDRSLTKDSLACLLGFYSMALLAPAGEQ